MKRLILTSLCLLISTTVVLGDWDPGDPYKMHWPQLPDPLGWDVYATVPKVLADDWHCTETGPVEDIHLWGSWREDNVGKIEVIHVSIHDNIPAGPDGIDNYSQPGKLLWERVFGPDEFTVRDYGIGDQGWFNPNTGEWIRPDHKLYHQINIENIDDPFVQRECEIYWLDISVTATGPVAEPIWGWKTSLEHFMDDAVFTDADVGIPNWQPLFDPITGETLDLAFVITPEPATIALLGFGSLILLRRHKK